MAASQSEAARNAAPDARIDPQASPLIPSQTGTKAALLIYFQGYAARLVRVLCIRTGPVDTTMTWPLPRLPFMASPQGFARAAWMRAAKGPAVSTYR
jgi:hypothetical protein